ncbi:MAG: (2Fe-2S)-binding protein [Cellulosilyticaceae bacterium]
MNEIPQEIKDKLEKICICRGTTTATVKDAIRGGITTYDELVKATGVTTGGCKGSRCKNKVQTLLEGFQNGEWV